MSADGVPLLRLHRAAFGYGGRAVVRGVDLELARRELVVLLGANGTGKTTLLRGILGLLPPLEGARALGGLVGYVPQRDGLDPIYPATVGELVTLGARRRGERRSRRELRAAMRGALVQVELSECESKPFAELSGGQLRRALLARALVGGPELLVLDEPFAGVDEHSRAELFELLATLASERGLGVLLVGHELERLVGRADRALRLGAGRLAPLVPAAPEA